MLPGTENIIDVERDRLAVAALEAHKPLACRSAAQFVVSFER